MKKTPILNVFLVLFFLTFVVNLYSDNIQYPHLLDKQDEAIKTLPKEWLISNNPYDTVPTIRGAEWDQDGYHISLKFAHGVVAGVHISKSQPGGQYKPPNYQLIELFTPLNINLQSPTRADPNNNSVASGWEWDVGDLIIRLNVGANAQPTPKGDQAGEVSSMEWLVRRKGSLDIAWW